MASLRTADVFWLNSHSVDAPGVTLWPLVLGDEVASSARSPVVLIFRDGSQVKLGASSRARITGSEEEPKFVLIAGTLDFKLVPGSSLIVTNLALERKRAAASVSAGTPMIARAGNSLSIFRSGRPLAEDSKFLIPIVAASGSSAVATALVTLPPVSRHR